MDDTGPTHWENKAPTGHPADIVHDYADQFCNTDAKVERRMRAMERAHEKGLDACEVCGRALKPEHNAHYRGVKLGPTCAKKLAKLGLDVTF